MRCARERESGQCDMRCARERESGQCDMRCARERESGQCDMRCARERESDQCDMRCAREREWVNVTCAVHARGSVTHSLECHMCMRGMRCMHTRA